MENDNGTFELVFFPYKPNNLVLIIKINTKYLQRFKNIFHLFREKEFVIFFLWIQFYLCHHLSLVSPQSVLWKDFVIASFDGFQWAEPKKKIEKVYLKWLHYWHRLWQIIWKICTFRYITARTTFAYFFSVLNVYSRESLLFFWTVIGESPPSCISLVEHLER